MRFDFAISFAGPQREIARQLAKALQDSGLSVFFDELFEHEMLGRDGADYLNNVFFAQSEHCVALVSRAYEERAWAQLERRAAQAREFGESPGFLIPILCDEVRPSWLLPTRIYFDLQQRSLVSLVDLLLKRAFSHPGGGYKLVAEMNGLFGNDTVNVAGVMGDASFLVWSTFVPSPPQPPLHLSRQVDTRQWTKNPLPVIARGEHLFLQEGLLIVIPEHDEPIEIISLSTGRSEDIVVPRQQRKWKSVTDCKCDGRSLLLSYCGGDVWIVDLLTREATELHQGNDEATYAHADWINSSLVVTCNDQSTGAIIYDLQARKAIAHWDLPEPPMAMGCLPKSGRVVFGSEAEVFVYSPPVWSLEHRHEVLHGVFELSCSKNAAVYGYTTGFPSAGNVMEVWDANTGLRILKERSGRSGGWSSLNVSYDGSLFAVLVGRNKLQIYETEVKKSSNPRALGG